jgi:predicted enzyme related to lactoylglutathione lyase
MHTHHAIDYIEFPVRDLAAAKRFYADAFGWDFNDYGPAYAGIVGEGKEAGGMYQSDAPKPGGALVVLYTRDLDASLAAVEGAGGVVCKPPFDFPGGRRFHFVDPSGHELAVWTPKP